MERRNELCLLLDARLPDHGMSPDDISCLAEILKDPIVLDSTGANQKSPRTFATQEHLNPIFMSKMANGNSKPQFFNLVHGYLKATGDSCLVPYLVDSFACGSTIGEIRAECLRLHLERFAIDLTEDETVYNDACTSKALIQNNARRSLCSRWGRLWCSVVVLALITGFVLKNTTVKFSNNQLKFCNLTTFLLNGCELSKNPISKTFNPNECAYTIAVANKCAEDFESFEPIGAVTSVTTEPTDVNKGVANA